MKAFLIALIFLPIFLFAQQGEQFVVKKIRPAKLYYSTHDELTSNTFYLVVSDKKVCFYPPTSTMRLAPKEYSKILNYPLDSIACHNYTINQDTIKFIETRSIQNDKSYVTTFFSFYADSLSWALRQESLASYGARMGRVTSFAEFIPPKKK